MSDVVDIFSKKKLDANSLEAKPFPWQDYVRNVRDIQAGFHTLDAHTKGVAMDAVANVFCEILESIFADKQGE